jgi:hypothetical protein
MDQQREYQHPTGIHALRRCLSLILGKRRLSVNPACILLESVLLALLHFYPEMNHSDSGETVATPMIGIEDRMASARVVTLKFEAIVRAP